MPKYLSVFSVFMLEKRRLASPKQVWNVRDGIEGEACFLLRRQKTDFQASFGQHGCTMKFMKHFVIIY